MSDVKIRFDGKNASGKTLMMKVIAGRLEGCGCTVSREPAQGHEMQVRVLDKDKLGEAARGEKGKAGKSDAKSTRLSWYYRDEDTEGFLRGYRPVYRISCQEGIRLIVDVPTVVQLNHLGPGQHHRFVEVMNSTYAQKVGDSWVVPDNLKTLGMTFYALKDDVLFRCCTFKENVPMSKEDKKYIKDFIVGFDEGLPVHELDVHIRELD